jgi:C-terminal processing protease CtpA/Prc
VKLPKDIFSVQSIPRTIKRLRSPHDRFTTTTSNSAQEFWIGHQFKTEKYSYRPYANYADCLGLKLKKTKGEGEGLQIQHVTPGSPADKAGITKDYRLLAVDGNPAEGDACRYRDFATVTKLTLDLVGPDGEERHEVTTTPMKKFNHTSGLGLWPIKRGDAWYVGYVNPGGAGDVAGITRGYQLIAVNGHTIESKEYLMEREKPKKDENGDYFWTIALDLKSPEGVPVHKELTVSFQTETLAGPRYQFFGDGSQAVGYLRFDDFLEEDWEDFKKEAANRQIERFIVDLRYNSSDFHFESDVYDKLKEHASWLLGETHSYDTLLFKVPRPKYINRFVRYDVSSKTMNPVTSEVIFLTSDYTCGAAENLILTLQPYLTTTVIGSAPTCGNSYATEEMEFPRNLFDFAPPYFYLVTGTYQNSQGETVPADGFHPYIRLDEDFSAEPGSEDDPLMQAALIHYDVSRD